MATVVTVVEIDVQRCALTYGTAPCEAALGVTGDRKCFNTLATCQDRANIDLGAHTLRFFRPSSEAEVFDGFAVLRDVSVTPLVLDPGNSIGQRETVRVNLGDFQFSDAGFDNYIGDRGYNPYDRGTFWGRFRARFPSLRGAPLRVLRGYSGQALSTFEVWHYVVETTTGPAGGAFTIIGKDALKFTSGDRAKAPRPSRGLLLGPLSAGGGSATLTPTGIGDLDYPAMGRIAIGGNEVASFTRTGDVLTLTTRGDLNTQDSDHEAGERVQLVLEYSAQRPDAIIADLLLGYTEVESSWVDQIAWQAEIEAFTPRLYSAVIAEPTAVDKLINELIAQVGLVMWTDTKANALRLIGLRAVSSAAAVFDSDRNMVGSFSTREQPEKRVSQAWCYFGQRNPLEPVDDPKNYACIAVGVDDTGADEEYGGEAIRTTFSRWINVFNRQAAEQVNAVLLARFRDPPRRLGWSVYVTDTPPQVGAGAFLRHADLQDDTGDLLQVPVQVISLEPVEDRYKLMGEEQAGLAADVIPDDKVIYIDANGFNLNLRDVYDSIYDTPGPYDTVTFIVGAGAIIGTRKGGNEWSITTGLWPELTTLPLLRILGRIMGRGGDGGGAGGVEISPYGQPGEHGILVSAPIRIDNQGTIAGGGGGGARGAGFGGTSPGGGGGQGFENSVGGVPGSNGVAGSPGTPEAAGVSGGTPTNGGDGGALGQDGEAQGAFNGGAAGVAVHGDDLVTWINEGTILGDRLDSGEPLP